MVAPRSSLAPPLACMQSLVAGVAREDVCGPLGLLTASFTHSSRHGQLSRLRLLAVSLETVLPFRWLTQSLCIFAVFVVCADAEARVQARATALSTALSAPSSAASRSGLDARLTFPT
eukprot:5275888-Pleurochrysis_carterae.AAC.1